MHKSDARHSQRYRMTSDSRTEHPLAWLYYNIYDCALSVWKKFAAKFVATMKVCSSMSLKCIDQLGVISSFDASEWSGFHKIIIIFIAGTICVGFLLNRQFKLLDTPFNNDLRDIREISHCVNVQIMCKCWFTLWFNRILACAGEVAPGAVNHQPMQPSPSAYLKGHLKFSNKIKWFMCSDIINWYLLFYYTYVIWNDIELKGSHNPGSFVF